MVLISNTFSINLRVRKSQEDSRGNNDIVINIFHALESYIKDDNYYFTLLRTSVFVKNRILAQPE